MRQALGRPNEDTSEPSIARWRMSAAATTETKAEPSVMTTLMVKAIIGTAEFERLSSIYAPSCRDLAYTADLLMERAPWIRDKPDFLFGKTLDDMVLAVFPGCATESIYTAFRPPFSYRPGACVYCDECNEAIDGQGYHLMGTNWDFCDDCFYTTKINAEHELAHPFRQNKCDFPEERFQETSAVAQDELYLADMTLKYQFKKRDALRRYRLALPRIVAASEMSTTVAEETKRPLTPESPKEESSSKRSAEEGEEEPVSEKKVRDEDDDAHYGHGGVHGHRDPDDPPMPDYWYERLEKDYKLLQAAAEKRLPEIKKAIAEAGLPTEELDVLFEKGYDQPTFRWIDEDITLCVHLHSGHSRVTFSGDPKEPVGRYETVERAVAVIKSRFNKKQEA
jgi:hypothetical protein